MNEVVEGVADRAEASTAEAPAAAGIRCDFCQALVPSVRRVALDQDYERLRTAHREQYACPACSEQKERERLERSPEAISTRPGGGAAS